MRGVGWGQVVRGWSLRGCLAGPLDGSALVLFSVASVGPLYLIGDSPLIRPSKAF